MPEQERPAGDGATEGRDPGLVTRSIEEFVSQLRSFTDRARGLAAGAVPSLPSLPSPPGAMSAAQLKAIADSVKAQRASLQAMVVQFQAFDEQLAVFERILEPLVEWSSTWARLEEGVASLVRRDNSGNDRRPSGEA
ncbi:hypothetical protein [Petropleomorpha daqingensis]|uniref:Uncharacterized protein n=1 Tax=Petropleomorpha daqingensis TaxID=2026353 RepID=A0A853CPL8_9ACTN|nr:hypothetical protein [Petropleomorpha daqingensis]NYJ08729.1 hypothetical protein [Petropleomorpha daqingensis]